MHETILAIGLLEDEAIELDSSALELAQLDHPSIDLAPYGLILDAIAERLGARAMAEGTTTAAEQAVLLAAVIGREYGFAGDRRSYDDPANADLIRVIDRRRGLPVSLAILYVSAARRLGWTADVLNTPGHVLAQVGPATGPVMIDPFDGGAIMTQDGFATVLRRMLGPDAIPVAEHVAPMTNRAVLVRLLMNQAVRAEAGGDPARALQLYDRMTVISPGLPHGWWERARLQRRSGDTPAARRSLSAMLEITRDPDLRAHISAALDGLAGTTH